MKKQLLLFSFLVFFTFSSFGQNLRHYISINPIGVSIPFGGFQSTSGNALFSGGYALPGWTGNIESGIFIHKNFGFVGQIGSMINQLDKAQKDASFQAISYESSYGNYKSIYGLIGLIGSVSINKLSFDVKITGGYLLLIDPSIYFKYANTYSQSYAYSSGSTTVGSLAIMPGLNIRYSFTKRIGIRLNADIIISTGVQVNKSVGLTDTSPGATVLSNGSVVVNPSYTSTYNSTYTTKITSVNLGLGIFYSF
jgi:hypothetical protein